MYVLSFNQNAIVNLSDKHIWISQVDHEFERCVVAASGDDEEHILWRGTEIECNRYFEYLCDSLEVLRPRYEEPAHTSTPKDPPPEQPF